MRNLWQPWTLKNYISKNIFPWYGKKIQQQLHRNAIRSTVEHPRYFLRRCIPGGCKSPATTMTMTDGICIDSVLGQFRKRQGRGGSFHYSLFALSAGRCLISAQQPSTLNAGDMRAKWNGRRREYGKRRMLYPVGACMCERICVWEREGIAFVELLVKRC